MATTPQPKRLFPELERKPRRAQRPDWDSIEYPSSDGPELTGTSWHEVAVHLAREALDRHYRGRDDLFVVSTMAPYYERGDKGACLIPDLVAAFGVGGHGRRVYKVWEEGGQVPQWVLEVASASTKDRDCEFKKGEYERLGVREYWQLDQRGRLRQPLLGHRLWRGRYEPLKPCGIREGQYEYRSAQLGLQLRVKPYRDGLTVAFHDRKAGRDFLTGDDMDRALQESEERANAAEEPAAGERQARLAAERRNKELEERLRAAVRRTASQPL